MSEFSDRLFEIDEIPRSPKSELLATFEELFDVKLDTSEPPVFHYKLVLAKDAVVYEQDMFGSVRVQYRGIGTFCEDNVISLAESIRSPRTHEGFLLGIFTPQITGEDPSYEPAEPLVCFAADPEDVDITSYAVRPVDIVALYQQSETASHALRMLMSARADLCTDTSSYFMTKQKGWPVYSYDFMENALEKYWPMPELVYLAEVLPSET